MDTPDSNMSVFVSNITSDPVLSSLWGAEDYDGDDLNLCDADSNIPQQDGTTDLEMPMPSSPIHDLFLGWHPTSPLGEDNDRDWGALDEQMHQRQLKEMAFMTQVPAEDPDTIQLTTLPAETTRYSELHSMVSSAENDLNLSSAGCHLELESLANVSIDSLQPAFAPNRPSLSRNSSSSSVRTERGRRRRIERAIEQVSRPRETSAFQEHVFRSNPDRSSSRASASSGRRGPLDAEARALMSAVKEVGACWRCKILRKSCSAHTPCDSCPKASQSSHWWAVGCRRGSLKDAMPHVNLCLRANESVESRNQRDFLNDRIEKESPSVVTNERTEKLLIERDKYIARAIHGAVTWNDKMEALIAKLEDDSQTPTKNASHEEPTINSSRSTSTKRLEAYISAIMSEIYRSGIAKNILKPWNDIDCGTPKDFLALLTYAASFEVKSAKNNLISDSLICLQQSLEVMHIQSLGLLKDAPHQDCTDNKPCKVDCVKKLTISLELCTQNMTAIFNKENLDNEIWWLSIFYSLCIQSIVRKVLIQLETAYLTNSNSPNSHDHFHLAARLFIAVSGRYDFLYQDQSLELPSTPTITSEYDISRIEEIKAAAQHVVKQPAWPKLGFGCSADFLRHIFEDEDPGQYGTKSDSPSILGFAKFTVKPVPYAPGRSDMDSYREFRSDWDLARRNYTKQIISIGTRHGWLSEHYIRTTKKWARIEAVWRKSHKITLTNLLKTTKSPPKNKPGLEYFFENRDDSYEEEETPQSPPIYERNGNSSNSRPCGQDDQLYKQSPRFDGDIYWPSWIRGPEDSVQEGWCGMCPAPGRWLPLDGPFQDDKDFNHGVSAATGKPFDKPREIRRIRDDPKAWWGLCGTCAEWVELLGSKSEETAWFVHSFGASKALSEQHGLVSG